MSETPEPESSPDGDVAKSGQPEAKSKGMSNLALRVATAAVAIPILLWMFYVAPPWVFASLGILVAAVGGHELGKMTLKDHPLLRAWMILASVGVAAVLIFAISVPSLVTMLYALVLGGALSTLIRARPLADASGRMAWLIAGPLYVGATVAAVAQLHRFDNGGSWVALCLALAWGSDTGGYFAGRAFGKHKLYELVSPKKTKEGAVGGLFAVVLFAIAMHFLILPELPLVHAIAVALLAGASGQAGDLCISVIKRSTKVKDSGNLIPGHGGLLDRIDAVMFTAPITLLYAHWVLGFPWP